MMTRIFRLEGRPSWLLLTILLLLGCGGGTELPEYANQLIPVSGIITTDGQPVSDANVTFHPAGNGGGQTAYGRTDAEGRYTLSTPIAGLSLEEQVGAVAGNYRVTVNRIARRDGTPVPEGTTEADAMAEGAIETVPPMFNDPGMSQLTTTVSEGQATYDFTIRLLK